MPLMANREDQDTVSGRIGWKAKQNEKVPIIDYENKHRAWNYGHNIAFAKTC